MEDQIETSADLDHCFQFIDELQEAMVGAIVHQSTASVTASH